MLKEIKRSPLNPFRKSEHYREVGDLRSFGHQVILHTNLGFGKNTSKLELIRVSEMNYAEIVAEIEGIFDIDALTLGVMRIDLAVDVVGLPVTWFRKRLRVKHKRYQTEFGKIQYDRMGKERVETLYFGKRPHGIRVYNKIEERRHEFTKSIKGLKPGAAVPTFEEIYGFRDGQILTRIERQFGSGRIPYPISTIGKLRDAAQFNPFKTFEIVGASKAEPRFEDYRPAQYLKGLGLQQMILKHGISGTIRFLDTRSPGNSQSTLKQ